MLPTQEQQKLHKLWDRIVNKGVGDKVLQKKYSPRSSLQTNPIQVRVFKAEGEVNPLQRGGHTPAPQPSPGVIIPTREVLISYPS